MGGKKRNKQKFLEKDIKESSTFSNFSAPAKNLRKNDLGAVIFGCKHSTINECLSNNLFGLPASHFSYIKNIKEGLPLFLFNYSDRILHGIFEAAGPGQMNINRYAWLADKNDMEFTNYPAQVRVRVRLQCNPLTEDQFAPIIDDNYYEIQHFYFELDHDQTDKLLALFASSPVYTNAYTSRIPTSVKNDLSSFPVLAKNIKKNISSNAASTSQYTGKWSALFSNEAVTESEWTENEKWVENKWEGGERVNKMYETDWSSDVFTLRDEAQLKEELQGKVVDTWEERAESEVVETKINGAECVQTNVKTDEVPSSSSRPLDDIPARHVSASSERTASYEEVDDKNNCLASEKVINSINLEELVVKLKEEVEVLKESQMKNVTTITLLEQQVDKSNLEIQELRNRVNVLEVGSDHLQTKSQSEFSNSVYIVGGFDGSSWLSSLESYYPSYDVTISHSQMNFVKMYASSASLNGELYHFGGIGSHTVESFCPMKNQWVPRPPLHYKNIHVAGASVNNKLFVVGGSKGCLFSSEVEYLDLNLGKWLPIKSMDKKRSAPAAVGLNNALYVTGGFDGESYSSSVERLDPREENWVRLPNMNKRKGCHSMVVLNEKIYTLGGYDGVKYAETVEYFDSRMGGWVESRPMNVCKGNFGAFVLGERMYAIGGSKNNNEISDIVECYQEGSSWEVTDVKAIGKRSNFSAIVL